MSVFILTFANIIIEANIKNVMAAVPISGCFRISMNGMKAIRDGSSKSLNDMPLC